MSGEKRNIADLLAMDVDIEFDPPRATIKISSPDFG